MSFDPPVAAPAGYLTGQAIAFVDAAGRADLVSAAQPLPVTLATSAATTVPLTGTAAASATVGPIVPELERPIWVTLTGTWTGTAQLLRSTDAGATKLPLTYPDGSASASWTGAVNAPVAEESCAGASYWLQFTRTSGTLTYEVRQ